MSKDEAAIAAAVDAAFLGDPADSPRPITGDRALFSRLYMEHKSSVAYLCRRYLQDARDVEEVVQETFLKLFLALPELESEGQVVAWTRRTATNLCIDRYRAEKRRPTITDLEVLPDEFGAECDEDQLVLAEDAAIVRDALADLPPLYRRALLAREVDELPLDVIAAELNVEPAQMKHVLHRARRAMRRSLESKVGRSVVGLLAALLAIGSVATGLRFFGSDRARPMGNVDANPLIDHNFEPNTPTVPRVPVAKPLVHKPAVKPVAPPVSTHVTTTSAPRVHHHTKHTTHTTKPAVVPPVSRPPVIKAPVVVPPVAPTYAVPAGPAFGVEGGVAQSGSAYLINRGVGSSATGTAALTTFSANTSAGALLIDQSVSQPRTPVVRLDAVSLGGVSYGLGSVNIQRTLQPDGSVAMTIFASVDQVLTPLAATPAVSWPTVTPTPTPDTLSAVPTGRTPSSDGSLLAPGTPSAFTVSLVLAPDGTVLYEHVAVAQA